MNILVDAFSLTPAKAVEYLRKKKLRISGNWYTVWKEQHSRAFTVANLTKMEVLQDIRDMINKAVDGETMIDSSGASVKRAITFQQFKKELVPRLKKAGWWGVEEIIGPDGNVVERQLGSVHRLRTIFNTNVQTALNTGRYARQAEVSRDLPYWQYVSVMDSRTTNRCKTLHGQIYRADDPVWDVIYPPNHWGCRAQVRALTGEMVSRENVDVQSSDGNIIEKTALIGPDGDRREVTVKGMKYIGGDGQPREFFPDPGWDYNPGKSSFTPDLSRFDPDISALYDGGSA
jgi:SPP1 gp7 family putative phage head morphogenesis protein